MSLNVGTIEELNELLSPVDLVKLLCERRIPHRGGENVFIPSVDQMLVEGLRQAWLDGYKHAKFFNQANPLVLKDLDYIPEFKTLKDVNQYAFFK